MISILLIIGILTVIGVLFLGILAGSFWGFIVALACGLIISIICFAFSKILENQAKILSLLQSQSIKIDKLMEKKTCEKCNMKYDEDMVSCPYCGFKTE